MNEIRVGFYTPETRRGASLERAIQNRISPSWVISKNGFEWQGISERQLRTTDMSEDVSFLPLNG